jgi:prolipoprotein diacylglyceryltransferase
VPRIWDGGIILYGAVLGGLVAYFVAYWLIFRKKGVQTRRFADAAAPTIALGLMLGRLGCFLNGCCFGGVTCAECGMMAKGAHFPLSAPPRDSLVSQGHQTVAGFTLKRVGGFVTTEVEQVDPNSPAEAAGLKPGDYVIKLNDQEVNGFDDLNRYLGLGNVDGWPRGRSTLDLTVLRGGEQHEITYVPRTLPLYPTQLYEVISMALMFVLLYAYQGFRRNPGQVAAVLMVGYGIHRFLNEILRDDPRPVGFERYGSLILVAGGVLLWAWLQWYKKPDAPVEPVGDAAKKPAEPQVSSTAVTPVMPGP